MRNIKVENVGHVMGHAQIVRAGNITEPSFNYINQVAMSSGMGRLASELSYSKAVSAMEMKRGENALSEANLEQAAVEAEAQGAIKGMQSALEEVQFLSEKNRQATLKRLSILEQQKKFFDSITINNVLSEYNEKIFAAKVQDLESNPGGEGHLQRMAQAHDDLVAGYLSSSLEPSIKSYLTNRFKEAGARVSSEAFNEEQTRTVARAELQLEEALERATLHVANGINPEVAIKELDPIAESIPDTMPWKEKKLKHARSQLIEYSLKRTALINPALAARNMSMVGGIYGELSPAQRLSVEHIIQASARDIANREEKNNQRIVEANIANRQGKVSEYYEDIWRGKFGYADLENAKGELKSAEFNYLLKNINQKIAADNRDIAKQIAIETKAAKDGNYYSFGKEEQNDIWLKKLQTEQWMFRGEPANDSNIMQAEASALKDFNQPIMMVKRDLKVKMLEGTAEQAMDAALAFRELYATNRIVLGGDHAANDVEVQAMLAFSTGMEDGLTIEEAQKKAKEILAPISTEERKDLEKQFNAAFANRGLSWGEARPRDFDIGVFKSALGKYGIEFEEEDYVGLREAKQLAHSYFLGSRGDTTKAVQMTAASIKASYRPSAVNGPGAEDYAMWQAPESLFAGKGYSDDLVRKVFCNRAAQLAAHNIGDSKGWLEILPVEEGQPNKCRYHSSTGAKLDGTFWFEHIPGSIGRYRVKYSYNRGFGGYDRSPGSGFWLTRKNSVGEEVVTIDIDDLDWNIDTPSPTPLLQQEIVGAQ